MAARAAATLLCVAALCGCDSDATESVQPVVAPQRPLGTPVDSTKPGEIAEGKERAFGLAMPRDMLITARFSDAVHAKGKVPFEPLANYVRERVHAERVDTGPAKTVFVNATLKGDANKRVQVEVSTRGGIVKLVVRNRTRPPATPGLSEEERWRRSGLTPDGRVLPEMNE